MATRMVRQAFRAALCVTLSLAAVPAFAGGIRNSTCLHSVGVVSCSTQWSRLGASSQALPWQIDARETAASAERERKWLARCQPVAKQDHLGISRYRYAAAGCEFGKTED